MKSEVEGVAGERRRREEEAVDSEVRCVWVGGRGERDEAGFEGRRDQSSWSWALVESNSARVEGEVSPDRVRRL